MDQFGIILIVGVLIISAWLIVPRIFPHPQMICTRCEGTGAVDERWPNPDEPSGWHELKGSCPKCDGKGKVRAA